jgi:hypothetical protein
VAKLTPKQQLWLHYYLTEANLNATEAARLAGYSDEGNAARVQGSRMLAHPAVGEAVREAVEARAMPPEEIVARLSDMARGSLDDFVDITECEGMVLNMAKAKRRGLLHTFETIKYNKFGVEIKRYSALDALDKLARVHKLFGDQATTIDVKVLTIVLDALPAEYREAVCAALGSEFQITGRQIGDPGASEDDRADHFVGSEDQDEG